MDTSEDAEVIAILSAVRYVLVQYGYVHSNR